MNNSQVAHLWANKSRNEAHGSHFYFEGDVIYSYGNHFPIARHVQNKKGQRAVLFTLRGYSVTTQKHISLALRAASHITTFHVSSLDNIRFGDPAPVMMREEFKNYKERIVRCLQDAAKARKNGAFHRERAEALAKEANAFAAFFGLRSRVALDSEAFAKLVDSANKAKAKQAKAEAARQKQVAAKLKATEEIDRADLERWKKGENFSVWSSRFSRLPVALRIVEKSTDAPFGSPWEGTHPQDLHPPKVKVMETSHGATVPYEDAKKATRFVCMIRKAGIGWHRNGETFKVGDFQLASVSATGDVVAGCHRIAWDEVERIGKAEGWL